MNINDVYLYSNDNNQQDNNSNIQQNQDNNEQSDYYVIQAGDNLWNISLKFDTTIDNLIKLNPQIINANLIYVGQQIRIK